MKDPASIACRRLQTPWLSLLGLYGVFVLGLAGIDRLPLPWWGKGLIAVLLFSVTILLVPLISFLHKKPVQKARESIAAAIYGEVLAGRPAPEYFVYLRPFATTGDMGKAHQRRVWRALKGHSVPGPAGGLGDGAALGEFLLEVEGDMETVLAEHLWPPPLLGLGRPGEHFGAARLAVAHETGVEADEEPWHEPIRRLTARACGLIVMPSSHEGTWWEIEHLFKAGYLPRTLFFLPSPAEQQPEEEQRWRETLAKLSDLGLSLPSSLRHLAPETDGCLVKFVAEAGDTLCVEADLVIDSFPRRVKVGAGTTRLRREILTGLCASEFDEAVRQGAGLVSSGDLLPVSLAGGDLLLVRLWKPCKERR